MQNKHLLTLVTACLIGGYHAAKCNNYKKPVETQQVRINREKVFSILVNKIAYDSITRKLKARGFILK